MKTFKLTDLLIQTGITVYALIRHGADTRGSGHVDIFNSDAVWIWLFGIGSWQVLSYIIHLIALRGRVRNRGRRMYGWLLLIAVILACIPLLGWFFLLFLGPAMAIFYFTICLAEAEPYFFPRLSKENNEPV